MRFIWFHYTIPVGRYYQEGEKNFEAFFEARSNGLRCLEQALRGLAGALGSAPQIRLICFKYYDALNPAIARAVFEVILEDTKARKLVLLRAARFLGTGAYKWLSEFEAGKASK